MIRSENTRSPWHLGTMMAGVDTSPVPETEPVSADPPRLPPPVLMRHRWLDLASVHWAVDPTAVAAHLPPGTRPDVLRGKTYVGLVPFRMVDAGLSSGLPVPRLGTFLETNVRLYSVDSSGRRGVVFCSLDCDRLAVVAGARAAVGLPYRWAAMSYDQRTSPGSTEHDYRMRLRWPLLMEAADQRAGWSCATSDRSVRSKGSTSSSLGSSQRGGACTCTGSDTPGTSPSSTLRGPCTVPSWCCWRTNSWPLPAGRSSASDRRTWCCTAPVCGPVSAAPGSRPHRGPGGRIPRRDCSRPEDRSAAAAGGETPPGRMSR